MRHRLSIKKVHLVVSLTSGLAVAGLACGWNQLAPLMPPYSLIPLGITYSLAALLGLMLILFSGRLLLRKESHLLESEDLLCQLTAATWEAVIIHDRGILLHANPQYCQMFGYQLEEVIGKPVLELCFPPEIRASVQARIEEKDLRLYKTDGRRKDGSLFPLEIRPRYSVEAGRTLRIAAMRDMTETKRLEQEMVQAEKLMSIGYLTAGMTHEINNPLAGILQNIQILERRLLEDLPKNRALASECGIEFGQLLDYVEFQKLRKIIASIRQASKRATYIIKNMLRFSRKSDSKMSPCAVPELIEETLTLIGSDYNLEQFYDFCRIEIRREEQQGLPEVLCDKVQIQQVLLNLLRNM